MPTSILTPQAQRAFSKFPKDLDEYALARYFTLSAQERAEVLRCRGDHNRLGFACQLCWLRWLGWQPNNQVDAPQVATAFLARQLGLKADCLSRYAADPRMWRRHAEQARQYLGWRVYRQAESQALAAWLLQESLHYDHARGLLEAAISYLRREKIVRPGLTTLERLVVQVRAQAEEYLGQLIDGLLSAEQKLELDALIASPSPGETSLLQYLKAPPDKATAKSLMQLLDKIEKVRTLGIDSLDLSAINPNRRKALAREARRLFPVELRRLEPPRRYAALVCLLSELLREFNDQAVETHDQLMRGIHTRSEGRRNAELVKQGRTINTHIHLLRQIGQAVLDEQIPDSGLRPAIFNIVSRSRLVQAVNECESLAQPEDYNVLAFINGSYSYVRQFGPRFLATLKIHSTEGGETILKAVEYLRRLNSGEQPVFADPPTDFIPYRLRKTIIDASGRVNRRLWELTLHDRLAQALRAGDIWVEHSTDHAPLSHDLQVPVEAKLAFLQNNTHLKDANQFLQAQHTIYLETLKRVNAIWPSLDDVGIEDGRLRLGRLKAEIQPEGIELARQRLYALLPHRKLPQMLREVLHWVDYLQPLREAVGDNMRLGDGDLDQRLLALLMAEGCNIGLGNMAAATPGVTYIQLAHIANRCWHEQVLEKAIACVINFYDRLPITRLWGEGVWSSADGQLVPAPVRTLYARFHPRAPRGKRVLNLFTYVYDRLMPYWGRVIETTSHESAYEIDGLLHHEADIHPTHQAVDTAGYTDNLFGLTSLGLAPASRILRKLEAAGEHHSLYRALQEVGRMAKTVYLLTYLSDVDLRRQVQRQLNKSETYHSLVDTIFWGHKGEMRLRDLHDQMNRKLPATGSGNCYSFQCGLPASSCKAVPFFGPRD